MSDNVADRAFVDTNVLVYTISTEPEKQRISRTLVVQVPEVVVSAQVLSEFTNACLRQELLALDEIEPIVAAWAQAYEVVPVEAGTVQRAYALKRRYGYSWWDSVMLSAALDAGCEAFYTEDLQDGQLIESRLRLINPFTSSP